MENVTDSAHSKPVPLDCALGTWQPIETAPYDKTLLLLGWYEQWPGEPPKFKMQVAPAGNIDCKGNEAGWLHGQAQYWMPLPAPPEST